MVKRYITRSKNNSKNVDNFQQDQQTQQEAAQNSLASVGQQILTEKIEKLYLQMEVLKVKLANAKTNEEAAKINEMVTNASKELAGVLQIGQAA